jgi:hypothetical protein
MRFSPISPSAIMSRLQDVRNKLHVVIIDVVNELFPDVVNKTKCTPYNFIADDMSVIVEFENSLIQTISFDINIFKGHGSFQVETESNKGRSFFIGNYIKHDYLDMTVLEDREGLLGWFKPTIEVTRKIKKIDLIELVQRDPSKCREYSHKIHNSFEEDLTDNLLDVEGVGVFFKESLISFVEDFNIDVTKRNRVFEAVMAKKVCASCCYFQYHDGVGPTTEEDILKNHSHEIGCCGSNWKVESRKACQPICSVMEPLKKTVGKFHDFKLEPHRTIPIHKE